MSDLQDRITVTVEVNDLGERRYAAHVDDKPVCWRSGLGRLRRQYGLWGTVVYFRSERRARSAAVRALRAESWKPNVA